MPFQSTSVFSTFKSAFLLFILRYMYLKSHFPCSQLLWYISRATHLTVINLSYSRRDGNLETQIKLRYFSKVFQLNTALFSPAAGKLNSDFNNIHLHLVENIFYADSRRDNTFRITIQQLTNIIKLQYCYQREIVNR